MEEIGLQELIDQVKRELLTPNPAARARDPYPIFVIDKIELEITVKVGRAHDGNIKLTVLSFAEVGTGSSTSQERGQVVKISLSPLISRDQLLEEVLKDDTVRAVVQRSEEALVKSLDTLVGKGE